MNILAQYGNGPKDKVTQGISRGILSGAILSPRYAREEKLIQHIQDIREGGGTAYFDPEFYATEFISHPRPNLGSLESWTKYFERPKRSQLITGTAVPKVIQNTLAVQRELGLSSLIAPNVYIRQSDSIETAIALNFLNQAKAQNGANEGEEIFGTIAIHRDALLSGSNFKDILDGLTGLDNPPDGYYVIVGSGELQSSGNFIRSDIYHPEVIAAWMYTNYVLALNGAKVINGYCFMMGPLLGLCGANAVASGWSSGLRKFCIDRYIKQPPGGRLASARYLCNPLLSFIKQPDFDAFKAIVPEIENGLSLDTVYADREPDQTEQALQAWEAVHDLAQTFDGSLSRINEKLDGFQNHIEEATRLWSYIQEEGLANEVGPNLERLEALSSGIDLFKEWAELA